MLTSSLLPNWAAFIKHWSTISTLPSTKKPSNSNTAFLATPGDRPRLTELDRRESEKQTTSKAIPKSCLIFFSLAIFKKFLNADNYILVSKIDLWISLSLSCWLRLWNSIKLKAQLMKISRLAHHLSFICTKPSYAWRCSFTL